METLDLIAAERRALAEIADGFEPRQWATPSLCSGWSVHDVVAHLTVPLVVKPRKAVAMVLRKRFDLDATIAALTAKRAELPSARLVADLREHADSTFEPPGAGPRAPLTDTVVHGQDMLRPLGIEHRAPDEALVTCLEFLTTGRTRGFVPKGRLDSLRFVADDLDWSFGAGPTVSGPATSLALVITGRSVALDDVSGDGADTLRSRL